MMEEGGLVWRGGSVEMTNHAGIASFLYAMCRRIVVRLFHQWEQT